MDDPVWVAQCGGAMAPPETGWECELVMPLQKYDGDLGMRTRAAVRRQLEADVPRSLVLIDGSQAKGAADVVRAASHPRMCTQAVLAPPVEWLMRAGLVAHELHGGVFPMVVEVGGGLIRVFKRLGIRTDRLVAEALAPACATRVQHVVDISVHADALHQSVVVTMTPGNHPHT